MSDFYLVQRLMYNPTEDGIEPRINPFGYGRMGHYDLDYMGSAEFEFGTLGKSYDRFVQASSLEHTTCMVKGHEIEMLWRTEDGDPADKLKEWVKGKCDGKQPAYDFLQRLKGDETRHETALWWALDANVQLGFAEDGHIAKLIESLPKYPARLRG